MTSYSEYRNYLFHTGITGVRNNKTIQQENDGRRVKLKQQIHSSPSVPGKHNLARGVRSECFTLVS